MIALIENARAKMEYSFDEELQAGIVLSGGEVKMLLSHRGSLVGSHVVILGSDAVLVNAQIPAYPFSREEEYDPKRSRRLLLHKNEILKLAQAIETKGLSVIPVSIGISGRHLKVRIAIARGKKQYERREELKRRDMDREALREHKMRVR